LLVETEENKAGSTKLSGLDELMIEYFYGKRHSN